MVMPYLVAPVDAGVAGFAGTALTAAIGVLWRQLVVERAQARADLREVLTAMHENTHVLQELRGAIQREKAY